MKQKITIVGLGPGSEDELTLGALKALKQESGSILLRTDKHKVVYFLKEQGIVYSTMDDLYEKYDSFDDVYRAMVKRVIEFAENGDVILGVPGHPMVGERLVLELLAELDSKVYDINIIPGISQADAVTALVKKAGIQGLKIIMAPEIEGTYPDPRLVTIILNVYNSLVASEVKLRLLRAYPAELEVYISRQKEDGELECKKVLLYEMDRLEAFDHTTCVYIPSIEMEKLENYDFYHLLEIMEKLRSPGGCPWDREQTHKTLKQNLIEEAYEVLEAIDLEDSDKIIEELGDLLLQVVFHSQIAKECGEFDIADVTTRICRKLIERHPHIFGNVKADTAEQVITNWEAIKKKEKGLKNHTQVLRDIPKNLPALMRGYKVQKKAALVGFDWDCVEDAMKKVDEELEELKSVYLTQDNDKIAEELGDLIFAIVNVARFLKVEPELALGATIDKFIRRFEYIENNADQPLEKMTLAEMDILWNKAKMAFSAQKDV
jgi:MazG family protein